MCETGHPKLKASIDLLRQHTTPGGPQHDDDGTVLWFFRHCQLCGSSICIEPEVNERIEAT